MPRPGLLKGRDRFRKCARSFGDNVCPKFLRASLPGARVQSRSHASRRLVVTNQSKHKVRDSGYAREGKGSIVNISSADGKVGGLTAAVYVGSKHAGEGITKSAAIELADTGVRVNVVGPGPVDWSRVSLCRFYGAARNSAPP